jgi:hypothetical protein
LSNSIICIKNDPTRKTNIHGLIERGLAKKESLLWRLSFD